MTNEEKAILLKDLCARLPYWVKVWYKYYPTNIIEEFATSIRLADNKIALSSKITKEGDWYPIEEAGEILIKPYLRPMESMTEEEREELSNYLCERVMSNKIGITIPPNPTHGKGIPFRWMDDCINWLDKKMFDYRGLIPMGLALPATEDMYK